MLVCHKYIRFIMGLHWVVFTARFVLKELSQGESGLKLGLLFLTLCYVEVVVYRCSSK